MPSKYIVGIDLGTTNSVVAFAELTDTDRADIQLLAIPQVTAPGTVESLPSLPSFLYLVAEHESAADYRLPLGAESPKYVVGTLARDQSAEHPERTVSAAKSWLAHTAVDRHEKLLPWEASDEIAKLSPVTVTRYFLEHLAAAWNQSHPEDPLDQQQVVLTVPASFDASARELTREAAIDAGIPANFVLLEEPQAAVYAWLADQGDAWRKQLKVGDRLLVCDVGGGTTDLTLIAAEEEEGTLQLQRLAVGKHLLVGGDNMDLALAHSAAQGFAEQNVQLDAWQSVALWHSCRRAKEALLSPGGSDTQKVSVLGRGRKLIGGTVSIELQRQHVAELLVEGFFPKCLVTDAPERQRQSGFVQLGLPFESDTAVTRHIADFLNSHGQPDAQRVEPTHVLFNGGVFRGTALRQRMLDVLGEWFPEQRPGELAGHHDLESAVARGAAYYGWTKAHGGMRIRGGTARSYYVGIETTGLAIPGAPRPLKALCVVPFGMEEGSQIDVPGSEIGLVLGQPVHFRFFSSLVRKQDQPGQLLDRVDPDQLQETDALESNLPATSTSVDQAECVPVCFQSRVTELGVLELWCVSTRGEDRWKLEFSVRE